MRARAKQDVRAREKQDVGLWLDYMTRTIILLEVENLINCGLGLNSLPRSIPLEIGLKLDGDRPKRMFRIKSNLVRLTSRLRLRGMEDNSWSDENLRSWSWESFLRLDGMGPGKFLLERSKYYNTLHEEPLIKVETSLRKELHERFEPRMLGINKTLALIFLLRKFSCTFKDTSDLNSPNFPDRLPKRKFAFKFKFCKEAHLPRALRIMPKRKSKVAPPKWCYWPPSDYLILISWTTLPLVLRHHWIP